MGISKLWLSAAALLLAAGCFGGERAKQWAWERAWMETLDGLRGTAEAEAAARASAEFSDPVIATNYFTLDRWGEHPDWCYIRDRLPDHLREKLGPGDHGREVVKELYFSERETPSRCIWLWLHRGEGPDWTVLDGMCARTDSVF